MSCSSRKIKSSLHIFFLTVAIQGFVSFEPGANISQFVVDSLNLHVIALTVPDIRDEYCEPCISLSDTAGMTGVVSAVGLARQGTAQ